MQLRTAMLACACLCLLAGPPASATLEMGAEASELRQAEVKRYAEIARASGIPVELRPAGHPTPRVVEAFPFFMELDLLEIRLAELRDVVDLHILIESKYTQTGLPKNLTFQDHKHEARFAPYVHKIVHVTIEEMPMREEGKDWAEWANENYVRDEGLKRGLARIQADYLHAGDGAVGGPITNDDLLLILDVDEIPRAAAVAFLKAYTKYPLFTILAMRWSFCGFFWLIQGESWSHANVAVPLAAPLSDPTAWTATVVRYYGHALPDPKLGPDRWILGSPSNEPGRTLDLVMAGEAMWSGWHCQLCVPTTHYRMKALAVVEFFYFWQQFASLQVELGMDGAVDSNTPNGRGGGDNGVDGADLDENAIAALTRANGLHPKWVASQKSLAEMRRRRVMTHSAEEGGTYAPQHALDGSRPPHLAYLVEI